VKAINSEQQHYNHRGSRPFDR